MQNVRLSRSSLVLGLVLGVAGTLAVERAISEAEAAKGTTQKAQLDRQHFHDSLDLVLDRYVEPVDAPKMMARGLKHMVNGLDPHSYYLTADERSLAQQQQKQGASSGLVTALDRGSSLDATLEIVAVEPGSPASKLGLSAGDRVLAIRGRPCNTLMSTAEAQLLLGGAPGERVDLTVDRGHGSEELSLQLTKLSGAGLVAGELLERHGHALGKVSIHAFRAGTAKRVTEQLTQLRRAAGGQLDGLILDLRGNPGGEVDEAVLVADLFGEGGVLTRTRGRGGVILREELATAAGSDVETPLVVLQDDRSASAAELLAVALRDNHRARVVGERSFGKGTVQEVIGIADGSLLSLTVARYFSPDDRGIDGHGVEPDVAVSDRDPVEAAQRELVELIAQR